ncbi:WD40 repeat-like protein [Zopfia rhizophila CBS 207.26]|uniref:WD40 repeat-like protein n=1 Tax=Zopfia rhizophila CBS 207.26 TaxID=1314779 RepID=A0A6A6EHA9_9PEZI|nr:WD40 repeat-like protein [Zopfia rhizophila CBS 207.26]
MPKSAQKLTSKETSKEPTINGGSGQASTATTKRKNRRSEDQAEDTEDIGEKASEANKIRKQEKKVEKTEAPSNGLPNGTTSAQQPLTVPKKNKKSKKQKAKLIAPWTVSEPLGGWFLPHDPVFSPDEKFLILAKARALHIYSTDTSLLTHTLSVGSGYLAAHALSSTKTNHLYTADSGGLITLWNWESGTKSARWDLGTKIRHIAVVRQPEEYQDLVFCHEVGNNHIINVHSLRTGNQASETDFKEILKTPGIIQSFEVLNEGKVIVVACQNSVMVGKRAKLHKTSLKDFEYTWREFQTSKRITTFDAYIHGPQPSGKSNKSSQDPRDTVDIAIGDQDGVIHVFEDTLSSLVKLEKGKAQGQLNLQLESLRPRRLHWHREAVGSLKWSRDGNYLISGGKETVLVMWQLKTGRPHMLPHLTSAIENIVVSPLGASYALSLANNSVVVLSTTELEPKTNIVELQTRRIDLEQLPRDSSARHYSFDVFERVPMAMDPKNPNQIIVSVPSSQPRRDQMNADRQEPYIQTFDLATRVPVSRQALTRNNATDFNTGPDRVRIAEPTINFLQLSHNGKWLATVDEWVPPKTDMGYLEEGIPEFNEEERSFRREIYLKFWRWDEKNALWTLGTRVDAPHSFGDVGAPARVFDLISEPGEAGFATVGEDRCIRIWRPKTRMRDGMIVRGADNAEGLVSWSLHRSVELGDRLDVLNTDSNPQGGPTPRNACLAFSADASVLAAGVSWHSDSDPGVIHIIDAEMGIIRRSIAELSVTVLSCLGIVGRYLIAVGDSIIVWDLVVDELVYCIPFDRPGIDRFERTSLVHLAVNEYDGTFAVSCPQLEKNETSKARGFKKASSRVFIFEPNHMEAKWSTVIPGIVLSLLPARNGKGYIILDSSASIRLISPRENSLQLITLPPEPNARSLIDRDNGGREDVGNSEDEGVVKTGGVRGQITGFEDVIQKSENDKPVVRPEQLQEIFDNGPSHALPPVKDLFNAVVRLYARKPRVSGGQGPVSTT